MNDNKKVNDGREPSICGPSFSNQGVSGGVSPLQAGHLSPSLSSCQSQTSVRRSAGHVTRF
jgi:hypothetical protein